MRAKHYHYTQGKEKENVTEVAKPFTDISDLVFLKKKLSIPDGNEKNKTIISQILLIISISLKPYVETHHWYQQWRSVP